MTADHPLHQHAEMLLEIGRPTEAIRTLDRLLAQEPQRVDALVLLARANLAAGRNVAADRAARAALAVEPDDVPARCLYALTADALGRADAVEHAEAAVALDPQLWFGHAVLGTVLSHAGRFDDATAAARQAVTVAPEEAEAHAMVGDVALTAGWLDAADQAYRAALRLAPDHAHARHNLGLVRMRRSGPAAGLRDIGAAAALDPELPEAAHNLAGFARGMVAQTGLAALLCVAAATVGVLLATASASGTAVPRLLAGLLAVVVIGWLALIVLRTPSPIRPAVWSTIRTRRHYWLGPASAAVAVAALLAYAGTGLGFLLALLAVPAVGAALVVRALDARLIVDR